MHSINASVLIYAPVEECYKRWMNFESFPQFMHRVKSVRPAPVEDLIPRQHGQSGHEHRQTQQSTAFVQDLANGDPQKDFEGVISAEVVAEIEHHGNQVWHWEIKGPLGTVYEWTAGIVMNIPNKAISWATTHNQKLPNTGTVNFLPLPKGKLGEEQTLLEVTLGFSAPGGIVGELLSDITQYGDNLLAEALNDFKCYVEREVPQVIDATRHCKIQPAMTSEQELSKELGASGETRPNPIPKQV